MPELRELTPTEQTFADKVQEFGVVMKELQELAAVLRAEKGDAEYAVLSTIQNHDEQQLFRANWPMLRLAFGL